jgi:hypothetical protein
MKQALQVLAINMAAPATRLRIARAAAPIVVAAARTATPRYSKPYHIFKRKNGKVSKVLAGNLTLSTQDISLRRTRIAQRGVVIVGPRYGRSGGGAVIGSTEANAYGNYAHMVYGSARAYGQRVSARATAAAGAAAMAAMQREALAAFSRFKTKEGL